MWQDTPDLVEVQGNVEDNLAYCEALTLEGFSDWRLPNFNESQLLVREFEYFVFDGYQWRPKYFINVPENRHWHSSTLTNDDPTRGYVFRYQYEPAVNYAGSWAANSNHRIASLSADSYSPRCVRNYAEPSVVLANSPPSEVNSGEPVVFDGSESYHADGEITAYEWVNLTTGEVLGTSAVVEAQFDEAGAYEIQLTITDQLGLSQSLKEPISLVVFGPPTIQISGSTHVWAGDSLILDASDTQDETGISTLVWTDTADGSVVATGPVLEVDNVEPGQLTFRLTATNGRGHSAVQDIIITAIARPEIGIDGADGVHVGDSVTLNAGPEASGPSVESVQWLSSETGSF